MRHSERIWALLPEQGKAKMGRARVGPEGGAPAKEALDVLTKSQNPQRPTSKGQPTLPQQVERFWISFTHCKMKVYIKCCFVFPSGSDNLVQESQ